MLFRQLQRFIAVVAEVHPWSFVKLSWDVFEDVPDLLLGVICGPRVHDDPVVDVG